MSQVGSAAPASELLAPLQVTVINVIPKSANSFGSTDLDVSKTLGDL